MENSTYVNVSQDKTSIAPCVNWHITKKCNYRCHYCFATFKEVDQQLSLNEALKVPRVFKDAGCMKLNFAGGEPLLYPHLDLVLRESRRCGLVTSIITNGSLLTPRIMDQLAPNLDWIGFSLDTADEEIQRGLGRGKGKHVSNTLKKVELAKAYGIKIKINTVVTSLNKEEAMGGFIKQLNPDRWKVFQVMHIQGENELSVTPLLINQEEFRRYKARNNITLHNGTHPVFETSEDIRGSYMMVGPDGRFFDDTTGTIRYWEINHYNLEEGLKIVPFDDCKYINRGGIYAW